MADRSSSSRNHDPIVDLTTQDDDSAAEDQAPTMSKTVKALVAKYDRICPEKTPHPKKSTPAQHMVKPEGAPLEAPKVAETLPPMMGNEHIPPKKNRTSKRRMALKRNREKQRRFRERRKALVRVVCRDGETKKTLFERLFKHIVESSRGKRVYTRTLLELTARVGFAPSAGGARAPLAGIMKSVTGGSRGWWCSEVYPPRSIMYLFLSFFIISR